MPAKDGQTLQTQSAATFAAYQAAYGPAQAEQAWELDHNAAIGQPGPTPAAAPPAPAAPGPVDPSSLNPGSEYYTIGQHNAASDAQAAKNEQDLNARTAAQLAYDKEYNISGSDQLAFEKATQAIDALKFSASLSGPRNAFSQLKFNYGLNSMGMSPALQAIAGQYTLPAYQAPQGPAQPKTLQTLTDDISNPALSASAQQTFLSGLPNPNQISPVEWNKLTPDTQQLLLGGYEAKGISGTDVQDAISKALPQYTSPKFGLGGGDLGPAQ